MKIEYALLCDAARVRDGLLHILGGGVTIMFRPELPGMLDVDLVVMLSGDAEDSAQHELEVHLVPTSGPNEPLARIVMETEPDAKAPVPGLPRSFPLRIPLAAVPVRVQGLHHVEVALNGATPWGLPFYVTADPTVLRN